MFLERDAHRGNSKQVYCALFEFLFSLQIAGKYNAQVVVEITSPVDERIFLQSSYYRAPTM